ncbi:MAG: NADH-quinone oxidoreductase subunit N [Planctomycetia bacterium]|jgi:NADH-quinone oxidoreductase subunit N
MDLITVQYLLPELILTVTAVVVYMMGTSARGPAIARNWTVAGIIVTGIALCLVPRTGVPGFAATELAFYIRWLTLLAGLGVTLLGGHSTKDRPEYLGSLLVAMIGTMLVAGTDNLVLLFIGLEAVSIPTYLLLFLGRRDDTAAEATAKYYFLSILATALTVYGLSFVYGLTGSMDMAQIAETAKHAGNHFADYCIHHEAVQGSFFNFAPVALVLLFAGIGFKAAIVPFHFYAPDVYQGSTDQTAAYLSIIPKIAAVTALVRLVMFVAPATGPVAWRIVFVLAVLTMTYANIVALWQNHLRRLMAYSSIAHIGYMLIGLAVAVGSTPWGTRIYQPIAATLFYLAVYSAATLGFFAILEHLSTKETRVENLEQLSGLGRARPKSSAAMAVILLSLTGIPPLVGFWGKFVLFASAIRAHPISKVDYFWLVFLVVAGAINAAIGATYYLKIIGAMYFRMPLTVPERVRRPAILIVIVASVIAVIVLGCYPGPLFHAAQWAAGTLF